MSDKPEHTASTTHETTAATATRPRAIPINAIQPDMLAPGLTRRYAAGDNTTIALFEYQAGAVAPRHRHNYEQVSYVLRGKLQAEVAGETFTLSAGEVVIVRPNELHKFTALEDTLEIDFFTPARRDWLSNDLSYLSANKDD